MILILAIVISYILGSIPAGYILGRALKGIDVRRYGSGNFGATNVFRVIGPAAGLAVLLFDMLKGAIPVILFGNFVLQGSPGLDPILVPLSLAVATVCGHNWALFLNFQGGKGVATTIGAFLGLSFKIPHLGLLVGLCLGIWALVVLATGFVSLGSILASISLPILIMVFNLPFKLLAVSVLLCLFVVYRHKSNISRLLRKEEKSIFQASGD